MAKTNITEKQLAGIADALRKAEPKERPLTRAEALAKLAGEIREAKKRGLTLAEIADLLKKGGVEASEATIKRAIATKKPAATEPA